MKTKISTVVAIIMMAFVAIAATPIVKSSSPTHSEKASDNFSFIRTHRQGKRAVGS